MAAMDPSAITRWLTSKFLSRSADKNLFEKRRARAEKKRVRQGRAHVVEYFHQVNDGYSHLVAQLLPRLAARYDIELVCHLVSASTDDNSPEPKLLSQLSCRDAQKIAQHYGLNFPESSSLPTDALVALASGVFAVQSAQGFFDIAEAVGAALWRGDLDTLKKLAKDHGCADDQEFAAKINQGNARRRELKHYCAAMLYYEGEWYWGVDRLYHLEARLAALAADKLSGQPLLAPRPSESAGELRDDGRLTLEVYPSIRSPYTAISFDRAVKLAKDTGVTLVVRPVLPMVMRGVSVTFQKGAYIGFDAAREARAAGVPYGNCSDPIGEPVRRCYSLYPWACEQDKGTALLSSFLHSAFAEGVNTNSDQGLKIVVEKAGLEWAEAKKIVGQSAWQNVVEANRLAMYQFGLWGVPSFRLLDENGDQLLALWGQDRLWLIAKEIQRHLSGRVRV